ncbi:unnamed protein product [Adineta ricciae]|uniref:Peptidase S1 domain-containing protein n=1 Tax=Adineta ricciae TaxID=249248 RepID=A0A813VUD4_ADIRI|nr:unnamed protein product [Adineta ricciae]
MEINNTCPSTTIYKHCSTSRRFLVGVLLVFLLFVVTGIILIVLASIKPCLFVRCHSRASLCINRSPFKGQCICDSYSAGNGRTVCDDCGLVYTRPNARIIGGVDADAHSWPFAVLIQQRYKRTVTVDDDTFLVSTTWMCGGTLINHQTVAHCLKTAGDTFNYRSFVFPIVWNKYYSNIESTIEVSVGLHDRRKKPGRRTIKVQEVIIHPSYSQQNLFNDIAIVKLEEYIQPSVNVQFVCLPYLLSNINVSGIVVGFGDTVPGANQGSLTLKQVNLTIYPNDFCDNVSPLTTKNWTTQICCGDLNGERDACQGDSGGGLFVQQNLSSVLRYTIHGIVSYGEQCASPMKPGIYTRVSSYLQWIQENSNF